VISLLELEDCEPYEDMWGNIVKWINGWKINQLLD